MNWKEYLLRILGINDGDISDDITAAEIEEEKLRMADQWSKEKGKTTDISQMPNLSMPEDMSEVLTPPKKSTPAPEQHRDISGDVKTHSFKMLLKEPEYFDECSRLVDALKMGTPVIINLRRLDEENARRSIDFMSGAACVLEGSVMRMSNSVFIFIPVSVDVITSTNGIRENRDI